MHVQAPDEETEIRDQAEFDEVVVKDGKIVLEVLAGLGILAALLMSIIALNQSSEHNTVTITSGVAAPTTGSTASGASSAKLPAKAISLGFTPFLIGDAIKASIAATLFPGAWKLVNRR